MLVRIIRPCQGEKTWYTAIERMLCVQAVFSAPSHSNPFRPFMPRGLEHLCSQVPPIYDWTLHDLAKADAFLPSQAQIVWLAWLHIADTHGRSLRRLFVLPVGRAYLWIDCEMPGYYSSLYPVPKSGFCRGGSPNSHQNGASTLESLESNSCRGFKDYACYPPADHDEYQQSCNTAPRPLIFIANRYNWPS